MPRKYRQQHGKSSITFVYANAVTARRALGLLAYARKQPV